MNTRSAYFSVLFLLSSFGLKAQYYQTYTTTADGRKLMEVTIKKTRSNVTANSILLRPAEEYQTMDGFGYAMTYSSCYNLMQMNPRDRHALLRRTFSPTTGYGSSYVRISIGCSDFSSTEYTLCDKQGLENFALFSDETDYVIPILKEILGINPQLKIIAAPWTCPKWMKIRSASNTSPYDSWTGGQLNPKYYATYAQYFVRFVEAFQAEGIPIYAVTPQNEPLNKGNCASLYMPWDEQAAFLNYLAPAFSKAGIKTKIYVFDHNYNYDNISGQEDYPIKVYNALDGSMEGSELIVGSAWHDYGGSSSELDDIHGKAPERDMIFTEASIGEWNNGRSLNARLLSDVEGLVINTVNRSCSAVLVWNYMLDMKRGPNLDGGCTTCYGAVDIDETDYHTVTANSHFYMISHVAAVVKPGAVRIGSTGTAPDIRYSCFRNPDGTYGVVAVNSASAERSVAFGVSAIGIASIPMPARSVVSVLLTPENPELTFTLGEGKFRRTDVDHFTLTATLQQGQSYETDIFTDDDPADWYIDPDFLRLDAPSAEDGPTSLRMMALPGTYILTADRNERSLLVRPVTDVMNAEGQGNLFLLGAAGSVGKPYYVHGSHVDKSRAIPMAEIDDKVYQATLTVGEQLNPSLVDFGFYGSDTDLKPQFMGRTGSDYLLTLTDGDNRFALGKGILGHTDGIVYLLGFSRPPQGIIYTITVDLTQGVSSGTLSIRRTDPSGVQTVNGSKVQRFPPHLIFDLHGRRLQHPPRRGLYIYDGRIKVGH